MRVSNRKKAGSCSNAWHTVGVSWLDNRRLPGGALIDQELRRGSCSAHQAVQHTQPPCTCCVPFCPAPAAGQTTLPLRGSYEPKTIRKSTAERPAARSRSVMDLEISPSS